MPPVWITEADVAALLSLEEALETLARGLRLEADGAAVNMDKTHVAWAAGGTLHALGACFATTGFAGTKTWVHTAAGATPVLVLFDSHTGVLRAIVEAFALGQLRTGAIAGLATRCLAARDADELAIIGTGKQAWAQVAAVALVRPLKRVRVFSPTPEHRATFAERLRAHWGDRVIVATSVADAVADAPIVTLATRARLPFLTADMLTHGCHINALGAITPERAEFAQDVFLRCSRVVVDTLPGVQRLSREFVDQYGTPAHHWEDVQLLSQVIALDTMRSPHEDLSLFKSVGMGISDLTLAIDVCQRATAQGVGRRLQEPRRVSIRLSKEHASQ
jgi:alanine dehydrogenase